MFSRLQSISLVAIVAAVPALAVDIAVYPNSVSCDDNSGGLQCGNIAAGVCCFAGTQDLFSARFTGLSSEGVPDFGSVFSGSGTGASRCGTEVNSMSVEGGPFCIDSGESPSFQGAEWFTASRANVDTNAECVEADQAFFANGQKVRINYDVPANITTMVYELLKGDPELVGGLPRELEPFVIAA